MQPQHTEPVARKSEAKYRNFLELIDLAYEEVELIRDTSGRAVDYRVTHANAAYERIVGIPLEEMLGRPVSEVLPGIDPSWLATFIRIVETGQSERFEREESEVGRWFDLYVVPCGGDHLQILFDNVTERKRIEAVLSESEKRFRALINAGSYTIYRMSPDWRRMYQLDSETLANTAAPIDDWVGKYIPEEDRPEVLAAIDQAIRTRSPFELEHRVLMAAGNVGWVLSRAIPMLNARGEIAEWFGAGSDVSERREVVEKLRQSEERQAFLLELSDALRTVADPVQVQQVAARMTGEYLRTNRVAYAETYGDFFEIKAGWEKDIPPMVGRFDVKAYGEALVAGFHAGRTIISNNTAVDPNLSAAERLANVAAGVGSYIGVPLVKDGRWAATFAVHNIEPRVWTHTEISLVQEVAERTWAAMERARAEAALRKSEVKFRTLFATMRQGYCENEAIRDESGHVADHRYILLNPAFEQLTGIAVAEAEGRTAREVVPGIQNEWFETCERVIQSGTPERMDVEVPAFERTYEVYVYPGEGERFNVLYDDVTERRRAEAALRESQERQEFLLKLSDVLRPLQGTADIQSETTRLLGEHLGADRCYYFEADHHAGEYIIHRDFCRGNLRSLVGRHPMQQWPQMTAALSHGKVLVVHNYADSPDIPPDERPPTEDLDIRAIILIPLVKHGVLVACMAAIQAVPRQWTGGEVLLVSEVAERTWAAVERARAETALRESEERFRLFVQNVREYALVQTDFEGTVTSWNPGAERLFGYSRADIIGKPFATLLPEADRHDGIISLEMAKLSRGEHVADAHAVQRKDGTLFWAEWITEPVLDDRGKLRGTAKVMRDETERQKAQDTLQSSLAEKESLLSEVHHRVKNNLQVITSLLNLQSRELTDQNTLRLFHETRNRVQAIASIHELLYRSSNFARINLSAYARQLVPRLVDFYGVSNRVTVEVDTEEVHLTLERAVPFGLLLNELVSNALKHGFPDGKTGSIKVSLQRETDSISLLVEDTGVGLPANFTADREPSLGLRLVSILVRQLHGKIQFHSSAGTSVHVTTPADRGAAANGATP